MANTCTYAQVSAPDNHTRMKVNWHCCMGDINLNEIAAIRDLHCLSVSLPHIPDIPSYQNSPFLTSNIITPTVYSVVKAGYHIHTRSVTMGTLPPKSLWSRKTPNLASERSLLLCNIAYPGATLTHINKKCKWHIVHTRNKWPTLSVPLPISRVILKARYDHFRPFDLKVTHLLPP